MEKQIEARVLRDIATKYSMFDNVLSMTDNVFVRKNMLKTIDKYSKDGFINFEFIDMKTTNESDYFQDYEGKLYKNKKPPFVCALMENLIKDKALCLAPYYIEALTTKIMEEANTKAKAYLNENKVIELKLGVHSSELIVTDHKTLPPLFSEMLVKMYDELKTNLNSLEGQTEFTQYVASKYNFIHYMKEQQELFMFKNDKGIIFGQINASDDDYEKIRENYSHIDATGSDISLIMMDSYAMQELMATIIGRPEARREMEKFRKECPWVFHDVPLGDYNFKFTPNSGKFKSLKENKEICKEYSNEINPICILKQKSLENVLEQKTKLKM